MGDFLDIMAWSAAEDAASAARSAEAAANASREETTKLIELQKDKEDSFKIKLLNKMLQDIFYDREVEFYNLKELRKFVNRKNYLANRQIFPKKTSFPKFPFLSTSILIFSSYAIVAWKEPFFVILAVITMLISLLFTYGDVKEWEWWKKNKKIQEEQRLQTIESTYTLVVLKLIKDYPTFSLYGMIGKYEIDINIKDTYESLKIKNYQKATSSLIELYKLTLDIDIAKEDELKMLKMFYNQEEDIQKLTKKSQLFSSESFLIYSNLKK